MSWILSASSAALSVLALGAPGDPAKAAAEPSEALVKEALSYKSMVPLHRGLVSIHAKVAELCRNSVDVLGPHDHAFIRTYASALTLQGKLKEKRGLNLPVGSMLVKEKFESKSSKHPSLITAMKKVKKGIGASAWIFVMVDMKTRKEVTNPRQPCLSCHQAWKANDGVSDRGAVLLRSWQKRLLRPK